VLGLEQGGGQESEKEQESVQGASGRRTVKRSGGQPVGWSHGLNRDR
jgi:hypothetical protein